MATTITGINDPVRGFYDVEGNTDYFVPAGLTLKGSNSAFVADHPTTGGSLTNNGTLAANGYPPIVVGIRAASFTLVNAGTIQTDSSRSVEAGASGPLTIINYGSMGSVAGSRSSTNTIYNYGLAYVYDLGSANDNVTFFTGSSAGLYGNGGFDTLTLALDNRGGNVATTGNVGQVEGVESVNVTGGTWNVGLSLQRNSYDTSDHYLSFTLGGTGEGQSGKIVGGANIDGAHLSLALANGFDPSGQTFTLIQGSVTGRFVEGASVSVQGYAGTLSYNGGSGSSLTVSFPVLQPVPQTSYRGTVFDTSNQAAASSFASGEGLYFRAPTNRVAVSYVAATDGAAAAVTISTPELSLRYDAAALHDSSAQGRVLFLAGGGSLYVGSAAADSYALTGDVAGAAYGFDGADTFSITGAGAHIVDAGAGTDTITASGAGAFMLSGGVDGDLIDASASTGNLHVYGNSAVSAAGAVDGDDVIRLGSGSSYANGNGGNDLITAAAAGADSRLNLRGGAGNDTIVAGAGVDSVNGNLGDDSILGGGGNDYLRGGQGNDVVSGGDGNDQLLGDLGDDTLIGGAGLDQLTGGAGADVFRFSGNDGAYDQSNALLPGFTDYITDFTAGTDKIDLAQIGTGAAAAANLLVPGGTAQPTLAAAVAYAQQLLDQSTSAATLHDVVLLSVERSTGNILYMFTHESSNAHGAAIDTVVRLDGATAAQLTTADFV